MLRAAAFSVLPALFLAAAPLPGGGARAQDAAATASTGAPTGGGYSQRGVPAEATAENAVKARELAYASAQRIAYGRMATELGLPQGLSAGQIDGLVSSVVVEQERSTLTGFNGRVTVNFNPRRVAALGGRTPGGDAGTAVAGGASSGISSGTSSGGTLTPPPVSAGAPASSWVDAAASYGSLGQWLDLRRRLLANPDVASVELRAISTDRARFRLGLRNPVNLAAPDLARVGVAMEPAPDGTWRIGLAGGA
ncbi:hypothetical protein [Roseomonas elaeocarpi]|uniref:Uncharacterized protein n=1 Tax=Roseomonas elaeocarpi TaxID=907779 RepID=A0ABV6JRZ3_9PROT